MTDEIGRFWDEFAQAKGASGSYDAFAFGMEDSDDPAQIALADELADLVLHGPKRATTSLLAVYQESEEEVPRAGDYSVILDGRGNPVCIIVTTRVDLARFAEVDEEFAWTEGEGDRSLAFWRRAHLSVFADAGVTDDTMMVLVRFDKVWPPEG